MFIVLKKRYIIISILLILFLIFNILLSLFILNHTSANPLQKVIVIDAGHGGIDGGSVGKSGTKESDLNLDYAICLKKYCEDYGIKVILTRKDKNGLYSVFSNNKKQDDMNKRKEIIEKNKPDLVISIHMNSFSYPNCRGAEVFYNKNDEYSKILAQNIQDEFIKNLTKPRDNIKQGDYFILNISPCPSVIVECGYISNPEEEKLLSTPDYKNKVCYSILCGIILYLT